MNSHNSYLEDAINEAYADMSSHKAKEMIENNSQFDSLFSDKLIDETISKDGELVMLRRCSKDTGFDNDSALRDYWIDTSSGKRVGSLIISIISDEEVNLKIISIWPLFKDNGHAQSAIRVLISKLIAEGFSILSTNISNTNNPGFMHILDRFKFSNLDSMDRKFIRKLDLSTFDPNNISVADRVYYFDAITEAGKEGVYKENYIFRDKLQKPIISPVLAKSGNRDKIIDFVGEFIDSHNHELSTSGPVYTFTFGTKQLEPIYDLFKIDDKFLLDLYVEMVAETYDGKISKFFTGWVKAAPHKILINAIMAEAVQKDYSDILECCEYMWAFTEYPILYRKYWPTGVKEDVMNYTIEHLGSKHKIKHCKTILELLKYDADTAIKPFIEKLKTAPDNVYMDINYRMRNQFNSKLRNINNHYYKNSELDLSQHTNVVQFDDGELADQEGHNSNITSIINKTISKFTTSDINNSFLKVSAEKNQVDKNNLNNFIAQIYGTKDNKIPKFIENVITYYFEKNPKNNGISPAEFLNFGLMLYRSIGTSKNPLLQEIKSIVNGVWMNDIINIRAQYQREATIIAYTRGVFDYMIFMINYYNN